GSVLHGAIEVRTDGGEGAELAAGGSHEDRGLAAELEDLARVGLDVVRLDRQRHRGCGRFPRRRWNEIPGHRVEHRHDKRAGGRPQQPVDEIAARRTRLQRRLHGHASLLDVVACCAEYRRRRSSSRILRTRPTIKPTMMTSETPRPWRRNLRSSSARRPRTYAFAAMASPASASFLTSAGSAAWTATRAFTRASLAPVRSTRAWLTSMPARSAPSRVAAARPCSALSA